MTAAHLTPKTSSPRREGRLGDRLAPIHRACLRDLQALVEAAKSPGRDIWPRWNAIRYVDTVFSGRFDRERHAIEKLDHMLVADEADRLWVAGELVAALRRQLRQSVGLCHRGADFTEITTNLFRAVEYWFAAVEEIVGGVSWDDVPATVREDVAFLGTDTAPAWSDLPVSLATSL
jgi:hypothetical protein